MPAWLLFSPGMSSWQGSWHIDQRRPRVARATRALQTLQLPRMPRRRHGELTGYLHVRVPSMRSACGTVGWCCCCSVASSPKMVPCIIDSSPLMIFLNPLWSFPLSCSLLVFNVLAVDIDNALSIEFVSSCSVWFCEVERAVLLWSLSDFCPPGYFPGSKMVHRIPADPPELMRYLGTRSDLL